MTVIPIAIGALGTDIKVLVQGLEDLEIRGRRRPYKLLHYWERLEYSEESWRLEETCCHLNFSGRPSTGVKTLKKNK